LQDHRGAPVGRIAAAVWIAAAIMAACSSYEPLEVKPRSGPPYIVVLLRTQAPPGVATGQQYRVRIQDLSANLFVDTMVTTEATDTVLMSVPPSTYQVTIANLPPKCRIQGGQASQTEVLVENTNTAVFRFSVICQAQLVLETLGAGPRLDREFVYRIGTPSGAERLGVMNVNDTLALDGFELGDHTVSLAHVADNCYVISDGGAEQSFTVTASSQADIAFRVACSEPGSEPRVLRLAGTYRDGVSAVVITAFDPDRDIDRYYWDLTDCHRRSVKATAQARGALASSRIRGQDTVVVLGVFEVGLPDTTFASRCVGIRLEDLIGNSTDVVEVPLGEPGTAPSATRFNAKFRGTIAIDTELDAVDPDGDFLGFFALATLRDGMFGNPDGRPDVGIFNSAGYLGTAVPSVPLGNGRPQADDYRSVYLYLFDRAANVRRIDDTDLFH
jgi:hypothetical protein